MFKRPQSGERGAAAEAKQSDQQFVDVAGSPRELHPPLSGRLLTLVALSFLFSLYGFLNASFIAPIVMLGLTFKCSEFLTDNILRPTSSFSSSFTQNMCRPPAALLVLFNRFSCVVCLTKLCDPAGIESTIANNSLI